MSDHPRSRNGAGTGKATVKHAGRVPPPGGGKSATAQTRTYQSTSQLIRPNSAEQAPRKTNSQGNKSQNNITQQRSTTQQPLLPLPVNPPIRSKKSNITLKKENPGDVIERKEVYKLLCENDVLITHVYNTPSGFTVKTDSPRSIDQILANRVSNRLKSLKLTPIPPPDYMSQKTVVVKGVDEILGGQSAEAIKEEILNQNAGLKIESVIKFNGMTRIFKIICQDTASAEKICREGFRAFYYNVNPRQVEQEEHVKVNTCFKCYALSKHNTNQCRSTTKICSECAETGHTWRECQASVKKCINCTREGKDASHRTLAMKCPLRKEIAKKIRSQKAESKRTAAAMQAAGTAGSTYAAVAANRRTNAEAPKAQKPSVPQPPPTQIVLNNDYSVKLMALVVEAHISSLSDGKMFSEYLSESIKLNYNVDVKFPERDSRGIFRVLTNLEQQPEAHINELEASMAEVQEIQPKTGRKRRATSPEESAESNEPRNKKNKGREDHSGSSTSIHNESIESNSDSIPGKSDEAERSERTSTPIRSPVSAASPKEHKFKILVTQRPKSIKGSDVAKQVLGDVNPRYKLQLQPQAPHKENKIIELLKKDKIKITPDDVQVVTKEVFNRLKPISYK